MGLIGVFLVFVAVCELHAMPQYQDIDRAPENIKRTPGNTRSIKIRDVVGPGNGYRQDFAVHKPWDPSEPVRGPVGGPVRGPFGPIVVSKRNDERDVDDDDVQEVVDLIRQVISQSQQTISASELLEDMSDLKDLTQDILDDEDSVDPQDVSDIIDEVGEDLGEDDEDVDDLFDSPLTTDVETVRLALSLLNGLADKLEEQLESGESVTATVKAINSLADVLHRYVCSTLEDVAQMMDGNGIVLKRQLSLGASKSFDVGSNKLVIDAGVSTKDFKTVEWKVGFKFCF